MKMTKQVTSAEFSIVVQGQAELRQDFKDMAKEHREDMKKITDAQVDLSRKFATYIERSHHTDNEVKELNNDLHGDDGAIKRIQKLEKDQEGDTTRWRILGAGLLSLVSVTGVVITIVLWALDRYLG